MEGRMSPCQWALEPRLLRGTLGKRELTLWKAVE